MDGIIHWTKKLNKISGVEFHLHQFRHTFAATMFRNGADILEVAIMLGHRTLRMTLVYLASIDDRNVQHKLASFNLEKMLV